MSMMAEIDLERLTGGGQVRNLSGRLRGVAAREMFDLDKLDQTEGEVCVVVPDYIYTLTPSFFQGMFAPSVQASGNSPEAFMSRYHFVADPVVLQQIQRGLAAILTRRDIDGIF